MNDNKTTTINNIVPHKAAERRTRLLLPVNQKVKFNLGPEHIERAQTLAALYVRLPEYGVMENSASMFSFPFTVINFCTHARPRYSNPS